MHVHPLAVLFAVAACAPSVSSPPASPSSAAPPPATTAASADPHATVELAIAALGGERVAAIAAIHRRGYGHWVAREFAENPDGPFETNYEEIDHWLDFAHARFRVADRFRAGHGDATWHAFAWDLADGVAVRVRDGKLVAGARVWLQDARHFLDSNPNRLVLAARAAPDLAGAPDVRVAGRTRRVVTFHDGRAAVRLEIDAQRHLLAAAEIAERWPADMFWSGRGDIRDRYELTAWVQSGGVWFPMQIDQSRNGLPYHHVALSSVEVTPIPDESAYAIPADVRAQFAALPADTESAKLGEITDLAPGVVLVGGRFNALLVDQPDGVVVIDAPVSAGYFGRVLDAARARFAHPPKAAIITGAVSPQLAGARRAAAAGTPLYVAAAARDHLDAFLRVEPGPAAAITSIDRRTTLGTGDHRVELLELGMSASHSLAAYLPAQRLLYVGTALRPGDADGWERPSQLAAIRALIEREHLDVERVVGSQFAARPMP